VRIAPSLGTRFVIVEGVTSIIKIDEVAARLVARSKMMTEKV